MAPRCDGPNVVLSDGFNQAERGIMEARWPVLIIPPAVEAD